MNEKESIKKVKRGEVYSVELGNVIGSEQGNKRPCVIIQNDIGNKFSPTTIITLFTGSVTKAKLPTHIFVNAETDAKYCKSDFYGGILLCEQIKTIDKIRLGDKIASLNENTMNKIDVALLISVLQNVKGLRKDVLTQILSADDEMLYYIYNHLLKKI